MKTVPALEPVASYKVSMMGYSVGVLVTLSRSLKDVSSCCFDLANGVENAPKAEKKHDNESESNDAASDRSPDHSKRNLSRSILDFVGHVKDRIISTDGEDDCQQADAPLNTLVFPAALTIERRVEDKFRSASSSHNDEDHNEDDEAKDVQNSRCNLKRREDLSCVDVAEDRQSHGRP